MDIKEVIIVGAGASGVSAAVSCGRKLGGENVLLLEKNKEILKKIYATGNGRCNITNTNAKDFIKVKFFLESLGITMFLEDEGRMYPMSGRAEDVAQAFENELKFLKVDVKTGKDVLDIDIEEIDGHSVFVVSTKKNVYKGRNLILALGGKAGSVYGTTGDGYAFARKLGHLVNKPIPVLTGIECDGDFSVLKGVRVPGEVKLYRKGQVVDSQKGEIQFTDYGVSGICVFNLSRHLLINKDIKMKDYEISLDLSRGLDMEKLLNKRNNLGNMSKNKILLSIYPRALAQDIMAKANIDMKNLSSELQDADNKDMPDTDYIKKIVELCTEYRLNVKGARGWKMAQCTKGGVALHELNLDTMESLLVKNLYFTGELIDYDGICGGYNLNNAWLTGMKAGKDV